MTVGLGPMTRRWRRLGHSWVLRSWSWTLAGLPVPFLGGCSACSYLKLLICNKKTSESSPGERGSADYLSSIAPACCLGRAVRRQKPPLPSKISRPCSRHRNPTSRGE